MKGELEILRKKLLDLKVRKEMYKRFVGTNEYQDIINEINESLTEVEGEFKRKVIEEMKGRSR